MKCMKIIYTNWLLISLDDKVTTIIGGSSSPLEPGKSTDCIHGSPSAHLKAETNVSNDVAMDKNSTVALQPEDNVGSCYRSNDAMAMDSSTEPVEGIYIHHVVCKKSLYDNILCTCM